MVRSWGDRISLNLPGDHPDLKRRFQIPEMGKINKKGFGKALFLILPFLSRVALICNLCFLGALVVRILPQNLNWNGFWIRTLLVSGLILAIPANLAVISLSVFQGIYRNRPSGFFPRFFLWTSALMVLIEVVYWLF